jgi:hypothetical protein
MAIKTGVMTKLSPHFFEYAPPWDTITRGGDYRAGFTRQAVKWDAQAS